MLMFNRTKNALDRKLRSCDDGSDKYSFIAAGKARNRLGSVVRNVDSHSAECCELAGEVRGGDMRQLGLT